MPADALDRSGYLGSKNTIAYPGRQGRSGRDRKVCPGAFTSCSRNRISSVTCGQSSCDRICSNICLDRILSQRRNVYCSPRNGLDYNGRLKFHRGVLLGDESGFSPSDLPFVHAATAG